MSRHATIRPSRLRDCQAWLPMRFAGCGQSSRLMYSARRGEAGDRERNRYMELGTLIFTKPQRAISDTQRAEERGFAQAWFPDSHMIWGDAYVCMALAAANTKSIKLGTGISV